MREQAMQPRHARVVHALDPVAEKLRRDRRLLGDRLVARAGARDDDGAVAVRLGQPAREQQPGVGAVIQRGAAGHKLRDLLGLLRVHACGEHAGLPCVYERVDDTRDLLGGLSLAVDDLAGALALGAREVYLCIPEVCGLAGEFGPAGRAATHRCAPPPRPPRARAPPLPQRSRARAPPPRPRTARCFRRCARGPPRRDART